MKFWKLEYPGPVEFAKCISGNSLPPKNTAFPGLKDTFVISLQIAAFALESLKIVESKERGKK